MTTTAIRPIRPKKPILAATGGPTVRPAAAAHLTDDGGERLADDVLGAGEGTVAQRGDDLFA